MIAQCPREGCDGDKAFFYQVQIRSADEPMTTFYKVMMLLACTIAFLANTEHSLVYELRTTVEGELGVTVGISALHARFSCLKCFSTLLSNSRRYLSLIFDKTI